jgi:hypothetical protein
MISNKQNDIGDIWGAQVRQSRRQTVGEVNLLGDPQYLGVISVRIDLSHMDEHKRPCKSLLYAGNLKSIETDQGNPQGSPYENMDPSTTRISNLDYQKLLNQLVIGSLFGDGWLFKPHRAWRGSYFSETHHSPQGPYLHWKQTLFALCGVETKLKEKPLPDTKHRKGAKSYILSTGMSPYFTQLRKMWYKQTGGTKKVRLKFLNQLDAFGLAIWYMDDGHLSINKNTKNAYLHTESFGIRGNQLIKRWFETRLGISPRLWKDSNGHTCLRFPQCEYVKLFPLIARYIHPILRYKLPPEFRNAHAEDIHNADYPAWLPGNDIVYPNKKLSDNKMAPDPTNLFYGWVFYEAIGVAQLIGVGSSQINVSGTYKATYPTS